VGFATERRKTVNSNPDRERTCHSRLGEGRRSNQRSSSGPESNRGSPRFMDQVRAAIRVKRYSENTVKAYCLWIRRFIVFSRKRHPETMGSVEVGAFLRHLVLVEKVSPSTQNQALCALVFMYRNVIGKELTKLPKDARARRPKNIPTVLTPKEIRSVLAFLEGDSLLIVQLLYGAGLRINECLSLRVMDLDLGRKELTVHRGKGRKPRRSVIPEGLVQPLQQHLCTVEQTHRQDVAEGFGRVALSPGLEKTVTVQW